MSNECKFKVGDKVRRKDGGLFSNDESVSTISEVKYYDGEDVRGVHLKETATWLYEDALELAEKPFTKSDLKDGMVVTYRNKTARIVFDDKLYTTDVDSDNFLVQVTLDDFYDDLSCIDYELNDIMKVTYMGEVLWERKEKPKTVKLELDVTPEQAEAIKKQLGIK